MDFRSKRERFSNLYVKNFGDTLKDKDLFRLFSPFGEIISAKVHKSSQGQPLGYGFVSFRHPQEAASAIKSLNGFVVKGRELFVDYYQTRDERSIVLASHHMLQGSNLIVQNLDISIDDLQLRSFFDSFGTITSAKVMKKNKLSLGYGFVCYSTIDAAERAVRGTNNKYFHGKLLSVKVHDKKAPLKSTNLRVSNLDSRVNDDILRYEFSKFGNIISAKVMTTNTGCSKNYGFVCYSSLKEAEAAIEQMHNKRLGHQVMCVKLDRPKRQNSRNNSESSVESVMEHKIFVKNIDPWMTEDSLQAIFSPFGTVIKTEVLKANGKSQCCAFVTFESRREAELAIWELDKNPYGEKNLEVSLLDDHKERDFDHEEIDNDDSSSSYVSSDEESNEQAKTNVYVKNLHLDVDEEDLFDIFSRFGTIRNIKIARSAQGVSRQFGFVNFTNIKSAKQAVEKMQHFVLKGCSLYVNFHQTKSERTLVLQQKLLQRLNGLAQKDQEKVVIPQRQRAVSQTRSSACNSDTRRQRTDAQIRSRSQAPVTRKVLPAQEKHIDDQKLKFEYKSRPYQEAKGVKMSVGQQLFKQSTPQNTTCADETSNSAPHPCSSVSSAANKRRSRYQNDYLRDFSQSAYKPKGAAIDLGCLEDASTSQSNRNSPSDNEEVLKKVRAFLQMTDSEVVEHLKSEK